MSRPILVVTDAAAGDGDELARTARSLVESDPRPSHWLVPGSGAEHERVTRSRWFRRSRISVLRADLPTPDDALVVFLRVGDELLPGALRAIVEATEAHPDVGFLYGDSVHDRGLRFEEPPRVHRPSWSPERLRSHAYVGDLVASNALVVRRAGGPTALAGAHPHDRALRIAEQASAHARLTEPLYRSTRERMTPAASARAVREHCARVGIDAECDADPTLPVVRVRRRIVGRPIVSVVVPTRGTRGEVRGHEVVLAANALRTLRERGTYSNLEIVVVFDHDTPSDARDEIVRAAGDDAVFVEFDEPFNFAKKVNLGVVHSRGEFVLFLNDDTEIVTSDALETLLSLLADPGVGMAGPMLLYPDGLIQSAGHVLNPVPYDLYRHRSPEHAGAQNLLRVQREVSGVIAAFALVRRSAFDEVGGLCATFPSNYNDVDFSLKLYEFGHRVLWTPHARVTHFESSTRSPILQPFEVAAIGARWRDKLDDDPFFHPGLERYLSIWKENVTGQRALSDALGPTAPIASK